MKLETTILNPKTDEVQLDPDQFDDHEDLTGKRIVKILDYSFTMVSHDPHGFWNIHYTKGGETPEDLKGQYTGVNEAEMAIKSYVNKNELVRKQKADEEAKKAAADKELRVKYAQMKKDNDAKVAQLNA